MKAWTAYHALAGGKEQNFSPAKILLEDRSRRALLLNPERKHHVAVFDVERGKNIAELQVKNTMEEIGTHLKA